MASDGYLCLNNLEMPPAAVIPMGCPRTFTTRLLVLVVATAMGASKSSAPPGTVTNDGTNVAGFNETVPAPTMGPHGVPTGVAPTKSQAEQSLTFMWGAGAWDALLWAATASGIEDQTAGETPKAALEKKGFTAESAAAFQDINATTGHELAALAEAYPAFDRVYRYVKKSTMAKPPEAASWTTSSQYHDGGWHNYWTESLSASGTSGDFDAASVMMREDEYAATLSRSAARE